MISVPFASSALPVKIDGQVGRGQLIVHRSSNCGNLYLSEDGYYSSLRQPEVY